MSVYLKKHIMSVYLQQHIISVYLKQHNMSVFLQQHILSFNQYKHIMSVYLKNYYARLFTTNHYVRLSKKNSMSACQIYKSFFHLYVCNSYFSPSALMFKCFIKLVCFLMLNSRFYVFSISRLFTRITNYAILCKAFLVRKSSCINVKVI